MPSKDKSKKKAEAKKAPKAAEAKKKKVKPIPVELAKKLFAARHAVKEAEAVVIEAKEHLKGAKDTLEARQTTQGELLDAAEKGAGPLFED